MGNLITRNQILLEGKIVSEHYDKHGIKVTVAVNRISKNNNKMRDYVLVWFEDEMMDAYKNSGAILHDRIQIVGEVFSKRIISQKFNSVTYTQYIIAKSVSVPDKFRKVSDGDTNSFLLKGCLERITETEKGYAIAVNLCDKENGIPNYPQVFTYGWRPKGIDIGDVIVIKGSIQSYLKKVDDKKIYAQRFVAAKITKG